MSDWTCAARSPTVGKILTETGGEDAVRQVLWKRDFLTGDHARDERNQHFVVLLNLLVAELASNHHCDDITVLCDSLARGALALLEQRAEGVDVLVRHLVVEGTPLPLRGTGACGNCALCDDVVGRLRAWLEPPARVVAAA